VQAQCRVVHGRGKWEPGKGLTSRLLNVRKSEFFCTFVSPKASEYSRYSSGVSSEGICELGEVRTKDAWSFIACRCGGGASSSCRSSS
jgi:hypothetical protein